MVSTSPTSCSSRSTPRAPTTWAATATPRPGRPQPTAWPARAFALRQAATPVPLTLPAHCLDDDGALSHVSRGPAERHDRAQPGPDDAGRGLHARGLSDGRVHRRVRARQPLGPESGIWLLRRPVRPAQVQAPRSRRRATPRRRGDGPRARTGSTATSKARSSRGSICTTRTVRTNRRSRCCRTSAIAASPVSTMGRLRSPISRWRAASRGCSTRGSIRAPSSWWPATTARRSAAMAKARTGTSCTTTPSTCR